MDFWDDFWVTDDLFEACYVYDPDAESYEIHEIEKKLSKFSSNNLSSITKTSGRINYSI